ncbi:MAG: hypothetical protein ABII27_09530 [bacterium]
MSRLKQNLSAVLVLVFTSSLIPGQTNGYINLAPPGLSSLTEKLDRRHIPDTTLDHTSTGSLLPTPLFPDKTLDRYNEVYIPRDLYIHLLGKIFLDECTASGECPYYNFEKINKTLFNLLKERNQNYFSDFYELSNYLKKNIINPLVKQGILKLTDETNQYTLGIPVRSFAVWTNAVDFIQRDISEHVIKNNDLAVLNEYDDICESQPLYPLWGTRYIVNALATMPQEDYNKVIEKILAHETDENFSSRSLINYIVYTFTGTPTTGWVALHKNIYEGTRLYCMSAEGLPFGGLGKVFRTHTKGLQKLADLLGFEIVILQPKYKYTSLDTKNPLNYTTIAYPIEFSIDANGKQVHEEIDVNFYDSKKPFRVNCLHGTNMDGIKNILLDVVESPGQFQNKPMYGALYANAEDGYTDEAPTKLQFCAGNALINWEYIKSVEWELFQKNPESWKPPILDTNDAQTLLVPVYVLIDYWKAYEKGDVERLRFFASFFNSARTHTYRNRGYINFASLEQKRAELIQCGFPEEFHYLFGEEDKLYIDITKAGLDAIKKLDCPQGVSPIHAFETNPYNPKIFTFGIDNAAEFDFNRLCWLADSNTHADSIRDNPYDPGTKYPEIDPFNLDANKVLEISIKAKSYLRLKRSKGKEFKVDPNKLVLAFIGRWVPEKWAELLLTRENIWKMVRAGVEIIVLGRYAYADQDTRDLPGLEEEIQKWLKRLPEDERLKMGDFIFLPNYTDEDERQAKDAANIIAQDSKREENGIVPGQGIGTGAAEITEILPFLAVLFGLAYQEGLIGKIGIPANMARTNMARKGNIFHAQSSRPEDYCKTILELAKLTMEEIAEYQAESAKINRFVQGGTTATAYLEAWARTYPLFPLHFRETAICTDLASYEAYLKPSDDTVRRHPELVYMQGFIPPRPGVTEHNLKIEFVTIQNEGSRESIKLEEKNIYEVGKGLTANVKINPASRLGQATRVFMVCPDGSKVELQRTGEPYTYITNIPPEVAGEYSFYVTRGIKPRFHNRTLEIFNPALNDTEIKDVKDSDDHYLVTIETAYDPNKLIHIGIPSTDTKGKLVIENNQPVVWRRWSDEITTSNPKSERHLDPQQQGARDFQIISGANGRGIFQFKVPKNLEIPFMVYAFATMRSSGEEPAWDNNRGVNYTVILNEKPPTQAITLPTQSMIRRISNAN